MEDQSNGVLKARRIGLLCRLVPALPKTNSVTREDHAGARRKVQTHQVKYRPSPLAGKRTECQVDTGSLLDL